MRLCGEPREGDFDAVDGPRLIGAIGDRDGLRTGRTDDDVAEFDDLRRDNRDRGLRPSRGQSPDVGAGITVQVSLHVYNLVDQEEVVMLAQYWLMLDCDDEAPCEDGDWYVDSEINLKDFNHFILSLHLFL